MSAAEYTATATPLSQDEAIDGSPRAIAIRTARAFGLRWRCSCEIRELRLEGANAECGKCGAPIVRRKALG
jgi:hypothetical protein